MTDIDTIRRATDQEIATARAWVEHIHADTGHSPEPELEAERQFAYEHALEVLIFANGGRHVEPAPQVLTDLATVVLDDRRDKVDDLMVAVLQRAAEAPPSPLRDAVIAVAEQAWADEYADAEASGTGTDESKAA